MKATKLIAFIAVAGLGLYAQGAFAQGKDPVGDAPPPMTETPPAAGDETQPAKETVTIDSGTEAGTEATTSQGIAAQPEQKEKLRVYSGKHDGNNVISDPR